MSGEWPTQPLHELCKLIVDCPHSTPEWTSFGVVVLRSQNIKGGRLDLSSPSYTNEATYEKRSRRARLQADDLVITREAPMGEVCMVPVGLKCCLGQRMVMLRVDPRVCDPRYLLFALQSPGVQHEIKVNDGTGTTVSNLRIPLLEALKIPAPPLPEQRAIARVLGALDDKIEVNREQNRVLEAMAAALFRSWFVDFDPVLAKAEGERAKADLCQTYRLTKAAFDALPTSFEDSALGPVPKGWEVKTLPEVFEINPRRSITARGPVPYLDMQSLPTSGAIPDDWTLRDPGSGMKFTNGDTLMARITPCLENGKTAFINCLAEGETGWGSTEYLVFRPKAPFPPEFAYLVARDEDFRTFAIANMTGSSGRQRVPATCFAHYELSMPPPVILKAFGDLVHPWFDLMKHNTQESRALATLRDTLLPKLLSGEVRVGDVTT